MKSLEERKAQRAKEAAEAQKENDVVNKTATSSKAPAPPFSAVTYLNGTPEAIQKGLQGLNDADFAKLEPSEKAGKKRAAVVDALTVEKNRRVAGAGGVEWNKNAG